MAIAESASITSRYAISSLRLPLLLQRSAYGNTQGGRWTLTGLGRHVKLRELLVPCLRTACVVLVLHYGSTLTHHLPAIVGELH